MRGEGCDFRCDLGCDPIFLGHTIGLIELEDMSMSETKPCETCRFFEKYSDEKAIHEDAPGKCRRKPHPIEVDGIGCGD